MDNPPDTQANRSQSRRLYRIPTRVLKLARARSFTQDFIVTEIGHRLRNASPAPSEERSHPHHLLIFVPQGQAQLEISGQTYRIKGKQAALIPASTPYRYGSNSDEDGERYWLKFEGAGAEGLLAWTNFNPQNPLLGCAAAENIKRHFNAILNAVERGYTEHTTLQLSLALIKVLISLHDNPLDAEGRSSTNRIESAMSQMREDVSKPQALAAYAKKAGYSVTQFSHLFRQHTGTSPINYLNELRIQRTAELLNNTDRTIKSIAYELGFEDPLYFSRNFRKCVGLSPRAYRSR
ncbi:AraC family transcriptional regulator [Pelagicoccus sp. SDUM812005]|uniref:AraC family transcriptional regulator n=1 Tax=Pelagicoccus sp. SDUM812005 TaxID=3041257 RepID=UPI002810848D|nr:AraC family transcriptional regulator [Pelagicoccus sp. SDUM812005]MDQ8179601.1 AraC family transcriptional regulator [Pelagicoccus sp. SDUM812005]